MKKSQVTLDAWEQELPRTLYNRLKPQYEKKLEALATTYPITYKVISREFRDNTIILDCDFNVLDACRVMMGWDLNNLYEYLNAPS
jgi:hypothetical protein